MNKYEAMFIIRPDLIDEDKKKLFSQINDAVVKSKGSVIDSAVWNEKKSLSFAIKKHREGLFYLMHFSSTPEAIKELLHIYGLNEDILRTLITKNDQ